MEIFSTETNIFPKVDFGSTVSYLPPYIFRKVIFNCGVNNNVTELSV